jgi:thiamine pyrophosphokinase
MKTKILKGLLLVFLGYILLVAFYFIFLESGGYAGEARKFAQYRESSIAMEMPMMEYASKSTFNYATLRFKSQTDQAEIEQKYEKVASIESGTEKYDEDEKLARTIILQHNALIQQEAASSSNELRQLHLVIGVPPAGFDSIVAALKDIGKLENFNVTKVDKTNDFLELKAKRTTLEKARDSLVAMKAQGGKIEELVKLEQEILKIEDQIQGLGVQLGQFDKVNEFCTARFNLAESKVATKRSPHFGYLVESLQWASGVYFTWLGIGVVGLLAVMFVLIIIEKSKIFRPGT